jgi:hypothetical protein
MPAAIQSRILRLPVWYLEIKKKLIFSSYLYGWEMSLTSREQHRLKMFEKKVMKNMFGSQSVEVTRDCRKLHVDELHDLHSPSNTITVIISERMRWSEHVAHTGENRNILRFLAGKCRCEWENNIKTYLKGT